MHTFWIGTANWSIEFGVTSDGDRGMFDNTTASSHTTNNAIICADASKNVIIKTDNAFKVVGADGYAYLEAPIEFGGYTSLGYGSYKNGKNTNIYGSPVNINIDGTMRAFGQNKVLWSGASYMNESQTANLSEAVSKQPNGIVLIWGQYKDGTAGNCDYNCVFVPKYQVATHAGAGVAAMMTTATGATLGAKYVYVHDTKVVGYSTNDFGATDIASGIKRTNTYFVLRHIVGV